MASVFDVANYVLGKTGKTTSMKLQKLVFYCQAYSLAWDGKPLFSEDFQAWANGPVCRELFDSHKGLFEIQKCMYADYTYDFDQDEIETMDAILNAYGDKKPYWLVELTHNEAPWIEARKGVAAGMPSSTVIEKERIQEFYSGLVSDE